VNGRRVLVLVGGAAALLALTPASAQAHLVVTGLGPFYDGVSHFGLSPEDLLPIAAFGLYAGLRGAAQARWSLGALTLGWIAGGALAMTGVSLPAIVLSAASAALLLLVGGLLALNRDFGLRACAVGAGGLGLVRGLADLTGAGLTAPHALTLLGMAAGGVALFALAASITLPMRRLWMIVAARVGGSWVAATGLLLAGWLLRYGAAVQ
jgi:hydrogenase/urease accessory protein HupE